MKRSVFCTVFLILFREFDTLFDGLFNGCSFIENNPASIHLYCSDVMGIPQNNCTSRIENVTFLLSVTHLKISACKFETVPESFSSVMKITVLHKLDVSHNSHKPFVDHILRTSYNSLEHLNASHLQLNTIPESLQISMPNLMEIDFSFNKITRIDFTAFQKLPKIKLLDLSSNKIKSLDSNAFRNLNALETLDLRANPILNITHDTFDGIENLKILRIDVYDTCSIFRLIRRTAADVENWKNILIFDTSCMDGLLKIKSENDKLVVHFSNKNQVRFTKNDLKSLKVADFGPNHLENPLRIIEILGSSIAYLDVSGNFIGQLEPKTFDRFDRLTWLWVNGTNLNISGFYPFENLSKLQMLDISNNGIENVNQKIKFLDSKIFSLAVSGNPLRELDRNVFTKFRNIEEIHLDHTNLQDFDLNVFEGCTQLRYIDVSYNNLTKTNFTLPSNKSSSLIGVEVARNNLTELIGLNNASYPLLRLLNVTDNPMSCKYVTELKKELNDLEIDGDPCNIEQTIGENDISEPENSSMTVIYTILICIIIIVVLIIAIGAVWFICRKKISAVLNHVYEEIGPPTHDPSYNHLNFRNLPPNNCILDHYNNDGRQNRRSQNNENDLDVGENIEMGEQYNRLNFDTPPNNKTLEHYNNSKPNQDDQYDADEAEELEVHPPNGESSSAK